MAALSTYSLLSAAEMAQTDPHGWILTLTSVSVVFGALIILWILFGLLGKAFTREKRSRTPDEGEAAAIALALEAYQEEDGDAETAAAIALALEQHQRNAVHDTESCRLPLRPSIPSPWSNPTRNFRKRKSI